MGKLSRRKGQTFERWFAKYLRERLGVDAKRGFQSRGGGKEQADVVGVPGIHFELKHGICPNPRAALNQAEEDSELGSIPVAVIKDNRCAPFVVMRLDGFMEFLSAWHELEEDSRAMKEAIISPENQGPGISFEELCDSIG